MQPQRVCYATFYTLTITNPTPGYGTIRIEPSDTTCDSTCSVNYPEGTQVTLTATPQPGYAFVGWEGDCARCGANPTCTIEISSASTCKAIFSQTGFGGGTGSGSGGSGSGTGGTGGGTCGTGGGGCSMGAGASPINALAYLFLPMLVALRRFIRR